MLERAERGLGEHLEGVVSQHRQAIEEIWERFLEIADTYYGPVISGAFAVAEKVRLQHRIWGKIRQDGEQLVESLTRAELGISSPEE